MVMVLNSSGIEILSTKHPLGASVSVKNDRSVLKLSHVMHSIASSG